MKTRAGLIVIFIFLLKALLSAEIERFDIPIEGLPYLGPENAPVTMIEFLDFQ